MPKQILIKLKMKMNLKKIIKKSFFTFFPLILCSFNLTQALMIKFPLRKLVNGADVIILGKVKKIQCEWSIDQSIILTIATLQVHEILKGDVDNNQVLVQYPGGEVGDIGLKVTDMPSFRPKEKVLVFLKSIVNITDTKHSVTVTQNFYPAFQLFGSSQGKYSIDKDGIAHKSGYDLISKDYEPDKSLSLEELRAKIKKIFIQDYKDKNRAYEDRKH